MYESIPWLSVAGLLLLVIALQTFFGSRQRTRCPYPPGPKRLPIIGNTLDLQALKDHGPEYVEWGKKYNSDIIFASAFGNNLLIINKQADADELFERRARIYADRPRIPMAKLIGWDAMISLLPYGNYWRLCRKISQQNFNSNSSKRYHPILREKVNQFLTRLLESPDNLEEHNKLLSVSFAMNIMYGYDVTTLEDPLFRLAEESIILSGNLMTPDASIINLLPFLGYIPPWLSWPMTSRKLAAKAYEMTTYLKTSMWKFAQDRVKEGNAVPSLVTDFIEEHQTSQTSKEEERAINDIAYTTYGGAVDTTIAFTTNFFYLMATHPEVQRKAQAEIDRLIGKERLPRFEDRPSLPYVEAIYREVMRWKQSMPLACPHALLEDDYYKGYFIPKGTTVIGNVWAMSHDEDVYPDPFAFKPERFFDDNGKLNSNNRILNYGFGRRVCVGKAVASSMTWLTIVMSLTCFNIGKAKDELGNDIEPNDGYDSTGFFTRKQPYRCSIVPRSATYRELIVEKKY